LHEKAAQLRARLSGDALIESNLKPDQLVTIQTALIAKGLLQNRVTKYGSNADGQFGPNTRMAIRAYQKAVDAPATGFLNADQRMALLDDPQERERLASQEAARKRQEEYEAKRQADEQVRQIAAAQAKAKQEAIEKAKKEAEQEARREAEQRAKQEVEDRERKRLEEEAKKATEWRLKIDEAQAKGADYLKRVDTEWSLDEKINPMTDDPDYTVTSIQQNEFGALAQVEGVCSGQQVVFEATLHDAKDRGVPLGLPRSTAAGIIGNKRINDYMVFPTSFPVVDGATRSLYHGSRLAAMIRKRRIPHGGYWLRWKHLRAPFILRSQCWTSRSRSSLWLAKDGMK
jgi:hypothetical protein